MQIIGYAFEHLEIDVLGGDLQRIKLGNKYVLTLSRFTSGSPFAIPMRNLMRDQKQSPTSYQNCFVVSAYQKHWCYLIVQVIQVRVIC